MADEFCAETQVWNGSPDVPDGQVNICELLAGHEGPHRDDGFQWITYYEFDSLEDYLAEFDLTPEEVPVAFATWVAATTGWDGSPS